MWHRIACRKTHKSCACAPWISFLASFLEGFLCICVSTCVCALGQSDQRHPPTQTHTHKFNVAGALESSHLSKLLKEGMLWSILGQCAAPHVQRPLKRTTNVHQQVCRLLLQAPHQFSKSSTRRSQLTNKGEHRFNTEKATPRASTPVQQTHSPISEMQAIPRIPWVVWKHGQIVMLT